MWFLGLIVGLALGASLGTFPAAFAGAVAGAIAGALHAAGKRDREKAERALATRLDVLERRLAELAQRVHGSAPASPPADTVAPQADAVPVPHADATPAAAEPARAAPAPAAAQASQETPAQETPAPTAGDRSPAAPAEPALFPDTTPLPESTPAAQPAPPRDSNIPIPERRADLESTDTVSVDPIRTRGSEEGPRGVPPSAPPAPGWWQRLLGGNLLAKIGVVLLFFGVASALKLAADYGLFPPQVRLLLASVAGVAMIGFGATRLARPAHRMFGLALQGGGFAILYLVVYFALNRYEFIGEGPAFALFTALGVGCVLTAARVDGPSLAVLGISGAFLAPVLAGSETGSHLRLFGYYVLLNAFVIGVNWFRGWRALNVAAFLFTFVVSALWGTRAYHPELFASTEAFLVVFFAMFSLLPVVYALRRAPGAPAAADAIIVFGTPVACALLQVPLVAPYPYGLAWSCGAAGAWYLALWGVIRARREASLQLLETAYLAIAAVLLTLSVPLAFGASLTAAFWALEGAGAVWWGARQQRWSARLAGTALQLLAAWYFAPWALLHARERAVPVINDFWLSAAALAGAALASAWIMRRPGTGRHGDIDPGLSLILLAMGLVAWFAAGLAEIGRFAAAPHAAALALAFVTASAAAMEIAGVRGAWRALRYPTQLLIIVAALLAWDTADRRGHALAGSMLLAFPLAIAAHSWLLARHERDGLGALAALRHLAGWWLVTAVAGLELAWIAGRLAPTRELWPTLAWGLALAASARLAIAGATRGLAPFARRPALYLGGGMVPLALALVAWLVIANATRSGRGSGVVYLPLASFFDATVLALLATLLAWRRAAVAAGIGGVRWAGWMVWPLGFFWLTTMAARIAHNWDEVPFVWTAMVDSRVAQSALSLIWTATALAMMIAATRRARRRLWFAGFTLLAAVGAKLLLVDLAHVGTIAWTASLLGIAVLVLAASYFSPAPPEVAAAK